MVASSTAPSNDLKAPVLNSWKEIAKYLGRGVRTVQRYERELQLPVRRVGGRSRKSVVALSHDLDTWLKHATMQTLQGPFPPIPNNDHSTAAFIAQSCELRLQCARLRAEHASAIAALAQNLTQMVQRISLHPHNGRDGDRWDDSNEAVSTMQKAS